jgi:hypothetical protein
MWFMVELLIGLWAEIVQRRVAPAPVVERLDVEEQIGLRLVAASIHPMVDQLTFQRAEEAFHGRIVVPASDAIHTGLDAMVPQQGLIGAIRVLAALIGVMDETCPWLA